MKKHLLMPARAIDVRGTTAAAIGTDDVGRSSKLGMLCSIKCPGTVILKAYDLSRLTPQSGITIISGFHSPIEKDCLGILLRGSGSIIVCPARRLSASRLPCEWQKAIKEGRMLLLSPFSEKQKRATAKLAAERNRFVASVADEVLIAYAHPGSKTETLCREVLASGKRVYTFNDPANRHLTEMGAFPIEPDHFSARQVAREEVNA